MMIGYKGGVTKRIEDHKNVIIELVKLISVEGHVFEQIQLISNLFIKSKIKQIYEGKAIETCQEAQSKE